MLLCSFVCCFFDGAPISRGRQKCLTGGKLQSFEERIEQYRCLKQSNAVYVDLFHLLPEAGYFHEILA